MYLFCYLLLCRVTGYQIQTSFRVFLVRLEPQQSVADLPAPEDIHVSSYKEVHHSKRGGAYVAEMFER